MKLPIIRLFTEVHFQKFTIAPNLLQLYSMKQNTSFGIDYCISAAISSWIKPLKVALQMELCLFNSRLCRNLKCIPRVSEHWSVSVLPTLIEWNLDILKFESILNASNVCINCIKLVILLTLFTILKLHKYNWQKGIFGRYLKPKWNSQAQINSKSHLTIMAM